MSTLVASILIFGLLIFFHELGHFMVAKAAGIKVLEFSLGFGPRLVGWKRGDTFYNLRAFPLGGFVRMAGMDPEEPEYEDARGFKNKSILQRILVIVAGPLMNFVLSVLLIAVIFQVYGLLDVNTNRVGSLVPGKPAGAAGIKPGDIIVEINGQKVDDWETLNSIVDRHPLEEIDVKVDRDGTHKDFRVKTYADEQGLGAIGIYPAPLKVGPLRALAAGFRQTVNITVQILELLARMFTGKLPFELGGPVRIVGAINEAVSGTGWFINLFGLAAFLSINLGLFNLFPIPALDGSRILFLLVEWLRGRPVEPQKENLIHMIGFGFLIMLIVMVTYNDLLQMFFRNKTGPLP